MPAQGLRLPLKVVGLLATFLGIFAAEFHRSFPSVKGLPELIGLHHAI